MGSLYAAGVPRSDPAAEAKADLIHRVSLLRRMTMAAPFEKAIDEHHRLSEASKGMEEAPKEPGEVMVIRYREEEAIYVQPSHDRVTVIFSTVFREETDRIFGRVFLAVGSVFIGIIRWLLME